MASMVLVAPNLGKTEIEEEGEKKGKGRGDEVFQLKAELVGRSVRSNRQWPGLFIGRPCWFRWRDIFSPAELTGARTCA